jgi:hypothetical protein
LGQPDVAWVSIHLAEGNSGQVLVAHTYNPSLLRRQRSGGSWFEVSQGEIVHEILFQKAHHKKWTGGVAQSIGPEFKPQYHKKKKKKEENLVLLFLSYFPDLTSFLLRLFQKTNNDHRQCIRVYRWGLHSYILHSYEFSHTLAMAPLEVSK